MVSNIFEMEKSKRVQVKSYTSHYSLVREDEIEHEEVINKVVNDRKYKLIHKSYYKDVRNLYWILQTIIEFED